MKVQYIKHSSFMVEFKKAVLVFDYFEGNLSLPSKEKHIYFFVSHKHADHFNPKIFEYAKEYQKITYVLSNDVKMSENYMNRRGVTQEARDKIVYIHKNEQVRLDAHIEVETLTSTDEGVAFLINYQEEGLLEAVKLYHAGDLNWWSWQGESQEEYEDMTERFQNEMKKLEGRQFDCAFVPLDPRQEDRFWWGFDYFMRTADAKQVFPMHCWEDYSVIGRLKEMEQAKDYRERIVDIHQCGECFELD